MLFAALIDNFNDNELGPEWGDSYGGAVEVGGRARVPCLIGTYAGYQTGRAWSLAGSSVYVKLVTRPSASGASEAYCSFQVTSATDGTSAGFTCNVVTGMLRLFSNVDYWDDTALELTYSATDHRWLRLRETAGTLYWDTAPDGATWTNRRTLATPAWIEPADDQLALDMFAYRDAGTADYAEYDNVNTLSDGAVIEGAATLTAGSTLAGTATSTVVASATLTADAGLTATPRVTVHAAAALTATASLTADPSTTTIPEEVLGLAAGRCDLHIEQGATLTQTITCALDSPDFTWDGWQARAQIRTAATETAELLLDLSDYLTVDGPRIYLQIPATVTGTLHRSGRWDLEVYQGSTVIRLLEGLAKLSKEVTR